MAKENSFDIVSKTDYAEITNAINQTTKEVSQRFDFKGSRATVELLGKDLQLSAEDETRLRNMNDILQGKLLKRGVSLKALDYQTVEPAAGGTVRQAVKVQQGIPIEKAKEVVKFIKDAKFKVQASIQGETVRISGKDRDTLQDVIATFRVDERQERKQRAQAPNRLARTVDRDVHATLRRECAQERPTRLHGHGPC